MFLSRWLESNGIDRLLAPIVDINVAMENDIGGVNLIEDDAGCSMSSSSLSMALHAAALSTTTSTTTSFNNVAAIPALKTMTWEADNDDDDEADETTHRLAIL